MSFDRLKQKWKRNRQRAEQLAHNRRQLLLSKGPPVYQQFGIETVYLFGSVLGGRCRSTSDIDLLVDPLPADLFWACWRKLEEVLEYPVDLHTESDDRILAQKIRQRGKLIYARQSGIAEG